MSEIPFQHPGDITVGVENEWQVCVKGKPECIDLVQSILTSHHYNNLRARTAAGDIPNARLKALEAWIQNNPDEIWENSWIRLPLEMLSPEAQMLFQQDLRQQRSTPDSTPRSDAHRFCLTVHGKACIRIPVSYLLNLTLLQILSQKTTPAPICEYIHHIADCFINDNTSPEISSFYPAPLQTDGHPGAPIAEETLRRFLLTQWLTAYANRHMGIEQLGQHVMVYAAPHPPIRQQMLNAMIPDTFYRELFISPCLSGWENGEAKFQYMNLCHQTLARSQINAVHKMKEAGIIQNNLVILPSLSHTGLSNNGLHISIGSRSLTRNVKSAPNKCSPDAEKHHGDLATKIIEHFLPLFVGTYSAAPWKLDFADFHPERILGFLPHELCATHLRMLWRRWKKKGRFKILGRALTPFGPVWLDTAISKILRFKGDFVPDFRLLDYPIALSSTSQCPALDGKCGNEERLLRDLDEQGAFDRRMPLYRLWRLREARRMGFSGFEARFYSLMPDTSYDMPHAVTLQALLTAFAYQSIHDGKITHADIPDTPRTESERRNIFFSVAAGLPTFYIKRDHSAPFMQSLIAQTPRVRNSRRYPGYWRVECDAYRKMLITHLRTQAPEQIQNLSATATLTDLEERLSPDTRTSAAARITSAIQNTIGKQRIPLCAAKECNRAAEQVYRNDIRHQETQRALDLFELDITEICHNPDTATQAMLKQIFPHRSPPQLIPALRQRLAQGTVTKRALQQWIALLLLAIRHNAIKAHGTDFVAHTQTTVDTGMHI